MDSEAFRRVPQPRNLEIFWAVMTEGRSQADLAREHGISRQRVSQIVRKCGEFVALATSDVYDGFPQEAQLQFACRVHIERLKKRHRKVADCFDRSMKPVLTEKQVQTDKGVRQEWQRKEQHGDWRLARALHEIEKEMCETRLLLYQRPWFGWEEANRRRKGDGGGGKGERRPVTPLPCGPVESREERSEPRPMVSSPPGREAGARAGDRPGTSPGVLTAREQLRAELVGLIQKLSAANASLNRGCGAGAGPAKADLGPPPTTRGG